jgi:hypothetical protein
MQANSTKRLVLSEDWSSVLIGLAVVLLVGIGLVGSVPWPLFHLFK